MTSERVRVAFVGQLPPPVHGQAIVIRDLLAGRYRRIELLPVPMRFSERLADVGRFRLVKLLHLAAVISRILVTRIVRGATVLYYPPAGADRIALYRDLAILAVVRPFFPKTVFHFQASGISSLYSELSRPLQCLFRHSFFRPTATIRMSEQMEPDGARIATCREIIIPNGVEDNYPRFERETTKGRGASSCSRQMDGPPSILFVGGLFEEKGVIVLLETCGILQERCAFRLDLIGDFPSEAARVNFHESVRRLGLGERVHLHGLVSEEEKWRRLSMARVFCFPSHYRREGMPLVLLEAMQFSLPVVATHWRGIPSVVRDGETGFLVPVKSPAKTAEYLGRLLDDRELALRLGRRGREVYLTEFTLDLFRKRFEEALASI